MKRIQYATLMIGAVLLIAGCIDQHEIKQLGLVYCVEGSPSTFNPQLSSSRSEINITSRHLYDRLIDIHPISQKLVGGLAISWSVSPDRIHYRFKLRSGVQFHDNSYFHPSRALNADDVVFTFDRILNPHHPYAMISGGSYPFFDNSGFTNTVRAIHRIDDHTVEFELYAPNAGFLANLASDNAVILSAEYGTQLLESGTPGKLDSLPIGTGPFQFGEYRADNYIRYYRHWRYWNGGAPLHKLVFDITPNPSTRLAKLLTGQCDVIEQPAALQLEALEERDNLVLSVQSGIDTAYLALNTERPFFSDPKVRNAVALGINRKRIIDAVYRQTGELSENILPPTSWAYLPKAVSFEPFSLNTAQNNIQAAVKQWPTEPLKLWLMTDLRTYNPNPKKVAELLQHDFAQMGLKVTVENYEWATLQYKLRTDPDYDMLLIGWISEHSDPDNFFRQQFSCDAIEQGYNYSRWCNYQFDELLEEANHSDAFAERIRAYHQIQTLIAEQTPVIPLAHAFKLYAYNESIQGIIWNPYSSLSFNQAFRK